MKFLIASFLAWKIWTIVFLFFGVTFISLRLHFLGGGLEHYLALPWFWAWANFDGEHYLAIAQHGYGNGEQAFFPLYPILMRLLAWPVRGDLFFLQVSGLLISHIAFFLGLLGLWKLVRFDFKEDIARLSLLLLLVFPTSFYFGSIYTESLFFALVVWSFYSARRGQWLLAGIFGVFASATRFVGIILLPVLLVEWWMQSETKKSKLKSLFPLFLVPSGLLLYMYYLNQTVGDPLAFLHSLTWFGEQRSATPILLPQVFWRYAKILLDIPKNDPLSFVIILEVLSAVIFLAVSIFSFFKLRLSYCVWFLLGYLLPTLSGSFSSLPRYVIILFPAFILFAVYLNKMNLFVKILTVSLSFLLLGISTMMFVRGYWLA